MGLIRGALFTLFAIMLFMSLLSMNTFWTISKSLDYNVLQPQLVPIVTDFIIQRTEIGQELDTGIQSMQTYCSMNNTEFAFSQGDISVNIPCSKINEGSDAVLEYIVADFIETNYYKEYDCDFWECSMDPPFHLISEKAKAYWSDWFYLFLITSIILALITFFLIDNKNDYPFILGGLLIISSLLFAKIEWILSFMGGWEFISLVAAFFNRAYSVFLITFITGIVLILLGVALKFLGLRELLDKTVLSSETDKKKVNK